jgi:ribonuclease HI
MAKINRDAGVTRNGDVGAIAIVARSEAAVYLGASAVHLPGVSDPEILEAMAVREGVNLAQDLNLPRIRLATDCLSVVKALKEVNLGSYSHIIQEIKANAASLEEVSFVNEHRSSNREAHNLARLVLSYSVGRYIWPVSPPEGVSIPYSLTV